MAWINQVRVDMWVKFNYILKVNTMSLGNGPKGISFFYNIGFTGGID